MAQGIFIAEVTDDKPAYGKSATGRLKSIAGLLSGGGVIPIGTVEWRATGDPSLPPVTGFAAPLLPWSTSIPVIGEYILILASPSPNQTSEDSTQESFFYLGPVNIDGDKNLNKAEGFYNRSATPQTQLPSVPKSSVKNVPAMQPLFGDLLFQDRNGSVIRMTSTQGSTSLPSLNVGTTAQLPFSRPGIPTTSFSPAFQPGNAGNPLMMITVGIPGDTTGARRVGSVTGLATAAEKPETDRSFIYMTSDQNINFRHTRGGFPNAEAKQPFGKEGSFTTKKKNDANENATPASSKVADNKYKNPAAGRVRFQRVAQFPITPTDAVTSQIIIGSDRINITAKRDSVIIGASKDVKIGTKNWRMEVDATMSVVYELLQQTIVLTQHVQGLCRHLDDTINQCKIMQFPTGVGPTGPCLNDYFKAFEAIQTRLKGSSSQAVITDSAGGTRGNLKERLENLNKLLEAFELQKRSERDKKKTSTE